MWDQNVIVSTQSITDLLSIYYNRDGGEKENVHNSNRCIVMTILKVQWQSMYLGIVNMKNI